MLINSRALFENGAVMTEQQLGGLKTYKKVKLVSTLNDFKICKVHTKVVPNIRFARYWLFWIAGPDPIQEYTQPDIWNPTEYSVEFT